MLLTLFSSIFTNFPRKEIGDFLENHCYDLLLLHEGLYCGIDNKCYISFLWLWVQFFLRKYLQNQNIDPGYITKVLYLSMYVSIGLKRFYVVGFSCQRKEKERKKTSLRRQL
jgi:hypothetical protein